MATKRRPASLGAPAALKQLEARELQIKKKNQLRAVGGSAIVIVLTGLVLPLSLRWFIEAHLALHNIDHRDLPNTMSMAVTMDASLLLFSLPIAAITKRESRSSQINQFLENGSRQSGSGENVLMQFVLALIMCGLLFGEFLIIDALGFLWLRIKLRSVDRHRAAIILEMLGADPLGIDPRPLLKVGENPLHLRRTLAYLMAYEWVDISRMGDRLTLLSPAKRQLRHARQSLFAVENAA